MRGGVANDKVGVMGRILLQEGWTEGEEAIERERKEEGRREDEIEEGGRRKEGREDVMEEGGRRKEGRIR